MSSPVDDAPAAPTSAKHTTCIVAVEELCGSPVNDTPTGLTSVEHSIAEAEEGRSSPVDDALVATTSVEHTTAEADDVHGSCVDDSPTGPTLIEDTIVEAEEVHRSPVNSAPATPTALKHTIAKANEVRTSTVIDGPISPTTLSRTISEAEQVRAMLIAPTPYLPPDTMAQRDVELLKEKVTRLIEVFATDAMNALYEDEVALFRRDLPILLQAVDARLDYQDLANCLYFQRNKIRVLEKEIAELKAIVRKRESVIKNYDSFIDKLADAVSDLFSGPGSTKD